MPGLMCYILSMPFEFKQLAIPGLVLVTPRMFGDSRGAFFESYASEAFASAGIKEAFVQDNQSRSVKGVVRGLHYQKNPCAQGKLVRCISGKILDVGVDIRKGSPHYGKWLGVELDGEKNEMLYVPPGFAHGFSVLSETAVVFYKVTSPYAPQADRGIRFNDPVIGIDWKVDPPVLSPKDAAHPGLADCDNNFAY
jgi:dTDP-4-dehydrorhamnose 3,5-epimerase